MKSPSKPDFWLQLGYKKEQLRTDRWWTHFTKKIGKGGDLSLFFGQAKALAISE